MPRKYHRPPAAKRRKPRKTNVPYAVPEDSPEAAGSVTSVAELDVDAEEEEDADDPSQVYGRRPESRSGRLTTPSHIAKDYSYVRTEVVRILAIAAFLIAALIITGILR